MTLSVMISGYKIFSWRIPLRYIFQLTEKLLDQQLSQTGMQGMHMDREVQGMHMHSLHA